MFKFIVAGCAVAGLTAAATVVASPANAVPSCAGLRATIVGTAGDDFVFGTKARDVVYLGAGADYFEDHFESPGGGNDVVCGGSGDDILKGLDGNDTLLGGTGDDQPEGGEGNDTLRGEDGHDHVTGGPGDDRMHAGPPGDYDAVSFAGSGWGAVRVDLTTGTATGQGDDKLTGFTSVDGSGRADVIRGTDGNNYIEGMGGRDKVYSLAGNDYIRLNVGGVVHAGPGSDAVSTGGSGQVRLGVGNDVAEIRAGRPVVHGDAGNDELRVGGVARPWILGDAGRDLLSFRDRRRGVLVDLVNHDVGVGAWSVETVLGSRMPDIIRGGSGDDGFLGGGGDDRLIGRGGADNMYGENGDDYADGGPGDDGCWAETHVNCTP